MMPKDDGGAEYTELCRGLERMARLYKEKERDKNKSYNTSNVNMANVKNSYALQLVRFVRRVGIKEAIKRYRIQQSGIDQQLPVIDAGHDAPDSERNYFGTEKIAVYTAEFGNYDEILEPVIKPDNIDYYVVTDGALNPGSRWKHIDPSTLIPEEYQGNPVLSNRWCKMHPHELFPDYRYSVYIDTNCLIVSDITELVNRMSEFPVAMFRHKNRDCVYQEIEACGIKNKVPRESLQRHGALLREHGVPEKYGLLEATIVVRRHNEPVCKELMDSWWQAFLMGSGRDQIALIDALWGLQIQPSRLAALGSNLHLCDLFIWMAHKSRI